MPVELSHLRPQLSPKQLRTYLQINIIKKKLDEKMSSKNTINVLHSCVRCQVLDID